VLKPHATMADNTPSKKTSESPDGGDDAALRKPTASPPANFDFRSTINVSEVKPEEYTRKDSLDPPTTKEKHGHVRGVSWDAQIADNEKMPKLAGRPEIIQPQISDASNSPKPGQPTRNTSLLPPRPPPMMKMPSRRAPSRAHLTVGTSTRKIDLGPVNMGTLETEAEELLMELEAETNLIRQIDDDGARIDPASNLLAGVNDDELKHDFSLDSKSPGSPRSPTSPNRARATSRDVHTPVPTKHELPMAAHRRQMTVEETLFGLTAALSAVHHAEEKKSSDVGTDEQMMAGHRRTETGASTDRMERAANLFFRKMGGRHINVPIDEAKTPDAANGDQTHTHTASTATPATSKWAKLRENVIQNEIAQRKKSDDHSNKDPMCIEEVDADIEAGEGSESGGIAKNGTDEPTDDDVQYGSSGHGQDSSNQSKKEKRKKNKLNPFRHLPYADKIKKDWDKFGEFLRPRKTTISQYARYVILYIWGPALGVAAILFHLFDNPPTGKGEEADASQASASWWIIFVCIREVFIVCLAKMMQLLLIDYFALNTQASLRLCGPLVTLLLVQSKGWPFMVLFWGLFNFALVTGTYPFSNHWLYWQDLWGLFNNDNPSGEVTNSHQFYVLCAVAVGVGLSVSLKRLLVSVLLGRQTFANYSQQLAKLMTKMLQISEVAGLAKEIEKQYMYDLKFGSSTRAQERNMSNDNLQGLVAAADAEDLGEDVSVLDNTLKSGVGLGDEDNERVVDTDDIDPYTGKLNYSQRARIRDLLGQWEEPPRGPRTIDNISISSVLHFRRALAHMDTDYPFSAAFGLANTRDDCVLSAQAVYERLLLKQDLINDGHLQFDTIAVLAVGRYGDLDNEKLKGYIRAFRPGRDGEISMVEFVKSVDAVYKELRMLKASVVSSSKIDQALEKIFNIAFYVLLAAVILSQTGFDVLALFISLSSVVLAFAFMIGSASAKYFEGLLLILVQRPYGIGDRINVSNTESEANMAGSQGWIVENVTLFTTTVFLAGTSERATISNGSLAKSRIINGARSPKPVCYVAMKFGIETPYKKVEVFKNAVEKFVKNRPREWLGLTGFRCARIEADHGFIEYTIVLQHRESWQNIVPVLNSKHTVHCFCLELAKKLDMRYKSPALPVDLRMVGAKPPQFDLKYAQGSSMVGDSSESQPATPSRKKDSDMDLTTSPHSVGDNSTDLDEIAAMFEGK